MFNVKELKLAIENIVQFDYGKSLNKANNYEIYNAVCKAIMGNLVYRWEKTQKKYKNSKQASYFSAEFLMGRALGNNLINLEIYDDVKEVLDELNIDINKVEDIEEDAGLGNGGLGRLAACFMESAATRNLPLTGYGIRYSYGLFKQKFVDGFQVEEVDNWLKYGDPWSIRRDEDTVIVEFNNEKVKAVPYDTPIIGYGTNNINTLRLFKAEPIKEFDFNLFNNQEYDKAVQEKNRAEDISRVLYPNDSTQEGKVLRLKQQYFFVSAGLQDLVKKFKHIHGNKFERFHEFQAIQLNDTHPVVAIPELMRILVENEKIEFSKAWSIVVNTFSYTNHTILREALEEWDVELYRKLIPRVYEIVRKIDNNFEKELKDKGYEKEKIDSMKIICNKRVRMAFLAIHGSHAINGVAKIHTNILKNKELKDWYDLYPQRFSNKTNGITPRRWLKLCNPQLSELITKLLGNEEWITHLENLKNLEKYIDNENVLNNILEIKKHNKEYLAKYIEVNEGIKINPNSLFDIQIKRLHEYKRQLLNAFGILDLYFKLKENPKLDIVPRTFIFGAKAAPGYIRAKAIIKFINEIAKLINNDADINGKIKVIFVQNYGVSYAEKLFPAADISEQISTAGKEASGTGNMKFMLNGAPTFGTYDGANIEIAEESGEENNFIFGARVEELEKSKKTYNSKDYYKKDKNLKRIVDTLIDGTFDDNKTGMFEELYKSLLKGASWHKPDNYFIFRDFNDYIKTRDIIDNAYRNRLSWAKRCLMNIANAGKFSSDRTIEEYAKEIWNIQSIQV